jgi:hypothetical protein
MIAVQPELELAWQEFESASTYAYAQREVSTTMDKSAANGSSLFTSHRRLFCSLFRTIIKRDRNLSATVSNRLQSTTGIDDLPGNTSRHDQDSLNQFRQEFNTTIKELRSDVRRCSQQLCRVCLLNRCSRCFLDASPSQTETRRLTADASTPIIFLEHT